MSEKLKPCPFCGGAPKIYGYTGYAYCPNDDCMVADVDWEEAILPVKKWNTRPIEDDLRKRIAELEAERRIEYANELLNKRDEIEDALLARAKRAEKIIEKVTQWGLKYFSDIEWYRMLAEWKGNPLPMTWGDIGELYKKETGLSWDSSSGEILCKWAKSKPDMFFEDEDGHICEKKKVPKASIAELEAERLELRKILGWAYDLDEYKDNPEAPKESEEWN